MITTYHHRLAVIAARASYRLRAMGAVEDARRAKALAHVMACMALEARS